MRKLRVAAAATSLSLLGSVATAGVVGAQETPKGVGTSQASTTVLGVQLGANGSLLGLRLVGDDAQATIDKLVGPVSAFSRLVPLEVKSQAVPALNLPLPAFESRSPGGNGSVDVPTINLSNPANGVAVPAFVASGTLNLGKLTSGVDAGSARSALDASLKDLKLAGGLVSVSELSSTLGASSGVAEANGSRSVKVGAVRVLDLSALLDGLGLKLSDLPVSTVTALLKQVSATVPGLGNGDVVQSTIDGLQAQITTVAGTVSSGAGLPTGQVTSIVGNLGLGGVVDAGAITAIADPVARANALVDQLQGVLADVLGDALSVLDNVTLLTVDGVEVGVNTKAVKDLEGSVAGITAKIGNVNVAGLNLPGVDLGAAATQVSGLVNGVTGKLQSVLGTISPDLANVVSVSVLDQTKSVKNEGGYNRTRAGITALTATIKAPANLDAIVGTIKGATGVGDVVSQAGLGLPALTDTVPALEAALGGAVQALTQGATVKVAEVMAASDFAAASQGTVVAAPGGELPRTGGEQTGLMALLASAMVGMAVAVRRFTRVPNPTK